MSPTSGVLPAATVVGRSPSLKEPQWLGAQLYWQEQRPDEGGRTTLLRRRAAGDKPEELTPGTWNLRSRVHEYGGGACSLGLVDGRAEAVIVHDADRCLWRLDLEGERPPLRLTQPGERAFGGGVLDAGRRRWIGVMEAHHRDTLVAVPLEGGEPQELWAGQDFCGYPVLSPGGSHLAWVAWQQPWMPWDRSRLWLGAFDGSGALAAARPVAGSGEGDPSAISVFQPLWVPGAAGDDLVVANDRSGWWNLEHLAGATQLALETGGTAAEGELPWRPLLPMEAEFALPQWVFGMATHAWDGQQLLALACRGGEWQLGRVPLGPVVNGTAAHTNHHQGGGDPGRLDRSGGGWQPLPLPFNDLSQLNASAGRLACLAGGPTQPTGLLELDLSNGHWHHHPAGPIPLAPEAISVPQALWFEGHGGQPTHAWFYPPAGGGHRQAPLLVKGHSGPTGMARTALNLAIQFWTSRGWGVVDVNYGGSTGFGRAYRERLNGQWGVVDVADCAAAARAVVAQGLASAERIAIEGGSAGGFTTLAALCFTDVFRAGACRYGVADLGALAMDTHRFEARYLDGLVGPWPVAKATYDARSPLQHADRIRCPVILFQGLDDQVVPPAQTERMALALRENGIPVEVHGFAEEGHGFRRSATQIQVLEATEAFFRRHFQL